MFRNIFGKKNDPTPEDLQAIVPPEVKAEPSLDTKVIEQPKRFLIQVGEYFPWKGFMFKVAEVNEQGFVALVHGVTGKRKEELKKIKKEQERRKREEAKLAQANQPAQPS